MSDVLFIGGLIPNDKMIEEDTINFMNNAANQFQKLYIKGLKENGCNVKILAAPFIGPYPKSYRKLYFKSKDYNDGIEYVSFNNIWGIRNLSRNRALKKRIVDNGLYKCDKVIIYSVHTPFAALAKQIKKLNPNTKICLIVPDLPEYMNLREKKSWLYKIGKIFDIRAFNNTLQYFDYFAYVSIHQNDRINKYNKKYMVIEYLTDEPTCKFTYEVKSKKRIVYTGALNFKFNIENLVKAFERIHTEAELIICGDGDATEYIKAASKRNSNIVYCGVVRHEKVSEIQKHADVLVNPRLNQDDYTRYSFPSKTIEYMRTDHWVTCSHIFNCFTRK